MASIAIITDSTSCIPSELQEKYNITTVPLGFLFGENLYLDNVSLSWEEFYRLLKAARRLPTTTSAPPGAFLEAFREAYGRGSKDVLCIVTGKQFSGTYSSACNAAELAKEEMADIHTKVMDSHSSGPSLGFVVLATARAAANGATLDEAAGKGEALIPRLYMLAVLDTLEYVAKGGRVPRVVAWLSSRLQVKPILQYHGDKVSLVERVRTKPRALIRLLELVKHRLQPGKPLHVAVFHAGAPHEAEELAGRVKQEIRPQEMHVSEFSQAMSIHSGPGLVGLAFYNEP